MAAQDEAAREATTTARMNMADNREGRRVEVRRMEDWIDSHHEKAIVFILRQQSTKLESDHIGPLLQQSWKAMFERTVVQAPGLLVGFQARPGRASECDRDDIGLEAVVNASKRLVP